MPGPQTQHAAQWGADSCPAIRALPRSGVGTVCIGLFLVAVQCIGCGRRTLDSVLVGTWTASTADILAATGGKEMPDGVGALALPLMRDQAITITFTETGHVSVAMLGKERMGSWTAKDADIRIVLEDASGLIHSVGTLFSAARARPTFARISSTVLRQTNGFGSSLCSPM